MAFMLLWHFFSFDTRSAKLGRLDRPADSLCVRSSLVDTMFTAGKI